MKSVRLAVGLVGVLFLGGGYFASQYFYFQGNPAVYYRAIGESSVPYISLALLVAVVTLCVWGDREEAS